MLIRSEQVILTEPIRSPRKMDETERIVSIANIMLCLKFSLGWIIHPKIYKQISTIKIPRFLVRGWVR